MTQAQVEEVETVEVVTGFDIADLEVISAANKISVIDDKDGNSISGFYYAGKNTEEYQNAINKIRAENIRISAVEQEAIDITTEEGAMTVVTRSNNNDRIIAMSVVTGWYGFLNGKEPIEFNKVILDRMFNKKPQWQTKILMALEKESNFTKG